MALTVLLWLTITILVLGLGIAAISRSLSPRRHVAGGRSGGDAYTGHLMMEGSGSSGCDTAGDAGGADCGGGDGGGGGGSD